MVSSYCLLLFVFKSLLSTADGGFFYTDSATCGYTRCTTANWIRFYGCSPDGGCDFQLQPWLFMLVSFIVLSVLCSLLCSFLRCIFCGCCDKYRR